MRWRAEFRLQGFDGAGDANKLRSSRERVPLVARNQRPDLDSSIPGNQNGLSLELGVQKGFANERARLRRNLNLLTLTEARIGMNANANGGDVAVCYPT